MGESKGGENGLARAEELRAAIAAANAIPAAVAAMQRHPDDSGVQVNACCLLAELVRRKSRDLTRYVLLPRSWESIIRTKAHPNHSSCLSLTLVHA